jgi:hypothetical protein
MPREMYALEQSCLKKIRNSSEKTATKRLNKMVKKGFIKEGEMHTYHCHHCDGWHLGHPGNQISQKEFLHFLGHQLPGV